MVHINGHFPQLADLYISCSLPIIQILGYEDFNQEVCLFNLSAQPRFASVLAWQLR